MRATDAPIPIELIHRVLGFDFLDICIYTAGIAATPRHLMTGSICRCVITAGTDCFRGSVIARTLWGAIIERRDEEAAVKSRTLAESSGPSSAGDPCGSHPHPPGYHPSQIFSEGRNNDSSPRRLFWVERTCYAQRELFRM
jgi:hypothetical protein